MSKNKGNVLVPLLAGALVVAVAAGYFFYQAQNSKLQPIVQNSTPTPAPSKTAVKVPVPSDTVQVNPNVKTYISKNLGVSFNYLVKTVDDNNYAIGVKEEGNKIYIYQQTNYAGYKDGQWVEVFSKEKNETLAEAIKNKFLTNYSPNDCFVRSYQIGPNKYPTNHEIAIIDVPKSDGEGLDTLSIKWEKCPEPYVAENGLSYFLMDKNHPEMFLYFSIGQYGINSGEEGKAWQDTIKFL